MRRRLSSTSENRAPGRRPLGTDHHALLPLREEALRQERTCRSQETHLILLFVPIDATICHGWSPRGSLGRVMARGRKLHEIAARWQKDRE
jgi:hypothetical protein